MMALTELQERVIGFITQNEPLEGMKGVIDEKSYSRAPIYQVSHREALLDNLTKIYTVTQFILGKPYFRSLCQRYIQQYASTVWDLNLYGDNMSRFIAHRTAEHGSAEHGCLNEHLQPYPYLSTLTAIEYALHKAYYEDDEPRVYPQALGDIPKEHHLDIRFSLNKTVSLFKTIWPIETILKEHHAGAIRETLMALESEAYLVVYRDLNEPTMRPKVETVSAALYTLLKGVSQNKTLGTLLQEASVCGISGTDLLNGLPCIIEKGWISRVEWR